MRPLKKGKIDPPTHPKASLRLNKLSAKTASLSFSDYKLNGIYWFMGCMTNGYLPFQGHFLKSY